MNTFGERLQTAIEKRGLSQAQAARQCGIAQQSINYIIKSKLKSSKLATQIAASLNINPEWLIFGHGKFEETRVYELPIIHSFYMLKKFLKGDLSNNEMDHTLTDTHLGDMAFAYLLEPKKLLICSDCASTTQANEYLSIKDTGVAITRTKTALSFPIFEWRTRHVDF